MAMQPRSAPRAPISRESHDLLIQFVKDTITHQGSWWRNKLERTDYLYYCMQNDLRYSKVLRERAEALEVAQEDILEAPVIVSQIETAVSVLADTFLSGYPLFGVIAPPERRAEIEQVETLIAHYDKVGKWKSALLRYFRSLTKYGVAPIGITNRFGYDMTEDLGLPNTNGTAAPRKATSSLLPDMAVPDLYNMIFDYRVPPNELHLKGDYIATAEMLPATSLKALLFAVQNANLQEGSRVFNLDKWYNTSVPYQDYHLHPTISSPTVPNNRWDRWLSGSATAPGGAMAAQFYYHSSNALLRRYQARLIPEEFKLSQYGGRTPMTFEFWVVNDEWIVYFAPFFLAHNSFSIGFTDLQNDDFGYGAKSEVEMFAPFQQAASTLLNSAVLGAERSVDDRALYDPSYLTQGNLTRQSGAGYIPLTKSLAMDATFDKVYRSIPFDNSAAYSMPALIREVVNTSQMLRGRNNFAQGLPMKGNRTLGEFSEVMQNADTRQQLPAMQVEAQAFTDVKSWIKQWIANNATPETLLNQRTQSAVQIQPQTIASIEYDFALSTGYFSKQMMANTDFLQSALQFIQSSEQLQQTYNVPDMFAYLMSLNGVKDLDQFKQGAQPGQPGQPGQPAPPAAPNPAPEVPPQ